MTPCGDKSSLLEYTDYTIQQGDQFFLLQKLLPFIIIEQAPVCANALHVVQLNS